MVWKILGGIVGLLFVLVVIVLIAAAMQPADYTITRTAKMKAAPEKVFAQVNNFHKWQAWSPWEKLDPNMKRTITGPEEGVGATYAWDGNDKAGAGEMEITESKAPEKVVYRLEFARPMEDRCTTGFTLEPQGDETLVTWTMSGKNDTLMKKAFCMFMDIDGMVGKDFDEGLAKIKEIVEKEPKEPMKPNEPAAAPAGSTDSDP